ncbi:MAG TPA: dihydrolipoamide acetyltransferase family protein [Kofleriaceae bacterium]|nr:dihydrolipoamide acetyltransferase family protein [Kofleriaceae bacterium]
MPQLGETVREGTVSAWRKQVGDPVNHDEPLLEIETDKVTVEVPATAAGVLVEILVPVGERVEVGTRLAVIRVAGEAMAAATSPGARIVTLSSARPTVPAMPAAIADASPPDPARSSGRITMPAIPTAIASRAASRAASSELRLSPVVKRLLAEHRIDDPSLIPGTGAEGRITRDDVLAYVAARGGAVPAADRVVPMSRIRQLTAEHMVRSVATSPHVLQAVEVDFLAVDRLRAAAGDAWRAREGFSLSYLPFVARAVCLAIPEFPHVNASVRGDSLVVHQRVHLGIAVDLDRQGLVVPVIKDAGGKTVRALAVEIRRLADRARRGQLTPDDLTEGTYTLSNSGPFGTLITAPIIHQPQVAILSTDGVRKRPVVVERSAADGGDSIEIRPVGVLAQCFDHRAFDGAYSAAFLARVRAILEQANFDAELT